MRLTVYVPREGTEVARRVDAKSGIVGSVVDDELVRVDFEGNRYGAQNIRTYADRVSHAADRHTWQGGRGYPTVARMTVPARDLLYVGHFDGEQGCVQPHDAEGRVALARWLELGVDDMVGLGRELMTTAP